MHGVLTKYEIQYLKKIGLILANKINDSFCGKKEHRVTNFKNKNKIFNKIK